MRLQMHKGNPAAAKRLWVPYDSPSDLHIEGYCDLTPRGAPFIMGATDRKVFLGRWIGTEADEQFCRQREVFPRPSGAVAFTSAADLSDWLTSVAPQRLRDHPERHPDVPNRIGFGLVPDGSRALLTLAAHVVSLEAAGADTGATPASDFLKTVAPGAPLHLSPAPAPEDEGPNEMEDERPQYDLVPSADEDMPEGASPSQQPPQAVGNPPDIGPLATTSGGVSTAPKPSGSPIRSSPRASKASPYTK